ncbi:hypothetical protein ABZP36_003542 [Zizania latifolia]
MDDFGDVFGEAKPPEDSPPPQRPVLFHAHALSRSRSLRLVASDLHSLAWDRSLSVPDLNDLVRIKIHPSSASSLCPFRHHGRARAQRDDVGIGGSLSDFLDYLKSCLSSGEVKLILFTADRNLSPPTGLDRVNLIATKAKGLPRITISLNRVTASAVNDVIANLSLSLYTAYRTTQEHASRAVSPSKVPPAKVTKRIAPTSRRARVRGALLQDTEENVDE